ncbi:MAG: OmpA family protein [Polyangiales bacterium]
MPDVIDQCPAEAERYNGALDDDGCPDATPEETALRGPIRAIVPLVGRRRQAVPEVMLVVDLVARILRQHPGITELTVEGHTDARGADAWNLLVSRARAGFVRDQLLARGVAPGRVVALGLGERCPAAPGVGPAVWQRNQRVRFVITRLERRRVARRAGGVRGSARRRAAIERADGRCGPMRRRRRARRRGLDGRGRRCSQTLA